MSALQQHIDDLTQVRHAQFLPDAQLVIDVMQKPKTTHVPSSVSQACVHEGSA